MLSFMFVIAILIEVGLPIALGILWTRCYSTSWKLFGVGVLTFIGSQVVHLPLVYGWNALYQTGALSSLSLEMITILNAVILGLLAGLCEEFARLVGYRALKEKGNSWGAALTLGAGHGGIESIIVGLTVLTSFVTMAVAAQNPSAFPGLPVEQIEAAWSIPWHMPLAGAVERISAITLHTILSVMVWLSVSRSDWRWLVGAILYHAVVDAGTVLAVSYGVGTWPLEGSLLVVTALNVFLLYQIRRRDLARIAAAAPEPAGEAPVEESNIEQ
jgi:uncharacterized membrane protein YhfC